MRRQSLKFALEYDFDPVAQLVEAFVITELDDAIAFRRDAGLDVLGGKGVSERVAVVGLVGDEGFGGRQSWIEDFSTRVVAHLAFGEQQHERLTVAIHDGVEFRVQAAFGAPDTAGNAPLSRRLAAVLWAFRWVVSIIKVSGATFSAARLAKISLNTPSLLQRTKRL